MVTTYADVLAVRRKLAAMIEEATRLDRALPNCGNDFKQMDAKILAERVSDARNFVEVKE